MLGRIGDADAADQQRGEADQREVLREPLDVALELRRGIAAVADFPAGLGHLPRSRRRPPPARRHRSKPRPAGAGGRSSAPGCRAAAGRWRAAPSSLMSRRGPNPMPPASLSGSLVSAARSSMVAAPSVTRAPGCEAEPREQCGIDDGAEGIVAARQQGCECRRARLGHHRAVERIGAVDGLHLDQRAAARRRCAPCARMVATADDVALGGEKCPLGRGSPRAGSARTTRRRRGFRGPGGRARRRGRARTSRPPRSPARRARCRRGRRRSRAGRRAAREARAARISPAPTGAPTSSCGHGRFLRSGRSAAGSRGRSVPRARCRG